MTLIPKYILFSSLSFIFIVLCSPFFRNPIVLEERLPLPEHKSLPRKKPNILVYTSTPEVLGSWKFGKQLQNIPCEQ